MTGSVEEDLHPVYKAHSKVSLNSSFFQVIKH